MFNLKGKTAFITGSYRGLGFAMARALGEAGASIILNGRDEEKLQNAINILASEGLSTTGFAFDITNKKSLNENITKIEEDFNGIDILVNNAGINIRGNLETVSQEDWEKVLALNLSGVFAVSQCVVKHMIRRGNGKIINIASLMSSITRPTTGPYTASKGGVLMLTKSMAVEWAKHNIQVNAIAPGYFHTEMTDNLVQDDEFNKWIINRTPARRWGKPEDLAGTVVFLASDSSNFINGQVIYVDGGFTASI